MTIMPLYLTYLTESFNGFKTEGPRALDNVNQKDAFHNYFKIRTNSAILCKPQGPIT